MNSDFILLIFPPGWSFNIGGPHIALPLLKGFLESRNVPVLISDLNIGLSRYYGARLSEDEVIEACKQPILSRLNAPYFRANAQLNSIGNDFNGKWDIQQGFTHHGFDPSSSDSVNLYSEEISPFSEYFQSEILPFVLRNVPRVVGLSVTVSGQLLPTFELCKLLRRSGYDGKIVLGGNVVARLAGEMSLDWVFDLVDGLITFQGEEALFLLWTALKEGRSLDGIPNLIWRKNGQIVSNGTSLLGAADFGEPNFQGLPIDDYWGISYLPIVGSRGCYYNKCTFCSIPYGWGNKGFIGHGSPESVFNDMKTSFCLYSINRFKFVEEALHPAIMRRLVDIIHRESFICYFEGYARFDSFWCDSDFLDKASKSGLEKVYLGLEIYPTDSRRRLNKGDSAPVLETLKKLHDSGIKAHLFCMFGYPGTGMEEAFSTIEFVLKNQHLVDSLDIFPFSYAKHTKVDLIEPLIDPMKDWALEYDYTPKARDVLSPDQVIELSRQLEELIWKDKPTWLHPIYRMYSPWQESLQTRRKVVVSNLGSDHFDLVVDCDSTQSTGYSLLGRTPTA